jgi:hypothetical protein
MRYRLRYAILTWLIGSTLFLSAAGQAFALKAGDKAPLFELPSTTGDKISLADYVGKKPVVLFFYVGAFTKT